MTASGFAALGYQIVWTQQAGTWLGHEGMAALAVVAAFFGGLALGAATLSRRIERSAHPARWYAGCEALIALWSLVLALVMAPAGQALAGLIGTAPSPARHWAVAFGGSFLLLLPATAAMGATLPAMERLTASWRAQGGVDIAALYAANTAGAVLGVLAVAFWLVPELGLVRTSAVCAALNGLCAWGAWRLQWRASTAQPVPIDPAGRGRVAWLLAATGLLGIGYEVLALRVLSQVCENTVYTFAWLLAVYLVGTALGAAAHARWGARGPSNERLLPVLAAAVLLGAGTLWGAEAQKIFVADALGGGFTGQVLAEATLAAAAFGLPTLVMGALFSQLCLQARAAGIGLGTALALNTAAAAFAPLVFGVLLLPALGPKAALLAVVAGYLLLLRWRTWRAPWALLPAGAAAGAALLAPPLLFVQVPEGGRILSHVEGANAAVSVVEDERGVAVLRINNRQQEGSSASALADGRQAVLPLLLHAHPERVLFLGLGTGVTATSAAAFDPALQVDAVELLPEVIAAAALFAGAIGDDTAARARVQLHAADARRFVRQSGPAYDLIVADNFHPARSGSAALYTVEHFRAVRERLTADGVFCQWLPLHQMDRATLQSIVRSYQAVFPEARALLATLSLQTPTVGLVARRDDAPFAPPPALPSRAADWGIDDRLGLLGSFLASPDSLRLFADGAPLNTDDRPVVSLLAPRITYAPDSTPAERLVALTRELSVTPAAIGGPALADAPRLAAYLQARNRFLEAGLRVRPSADVRGMLAQVQEPLLAVLRISPEFAPAREPLLRMAQALRTVDPAAATALSAELGRLPAAP